MRFEAIGVKQFGCLRSLPTDSGSSLPSIVVVQGPNESGKSTFFSLLITLLYGFNLLRRKPHPHKPWDGGNAEGWARLRKDDGVEVVEVTRRLSDGTLGNKPLDVAAHVTRARFRHVYAVSLPDLAKLKSENWNLLQERLISTMGTKALRPTQDVVKEFVAQGKRYWKSDKRGHPPVARALRDELKELRKKRQEAIARDDKLRAKTKEQEETRASLQALEAKLEATRERQRILNDRLLRLRPVVRTLARIRALRAGTPQGLDVDTSLLEALLPDPKGRLAKLRSQVAEADERLAKHRRRAAAARATIQRYETKHRKIAEAESELHEAVKSQAVVGQMEAEVKEAQKAAHEAEQRCREHAERHFSVDFDDIPDSTLEPLLADKLRRHVKEYQRLGDERRSAEASSHGNPRWTVWGLVVTVLILVGIATSLVVPCVVVPFIILFVCRQEYVRRSAKKSRIRAARAAEEEDRTKIVDALSGFAVLPSLLERPGLELVTAVAHMAELGNGLRKWLEALNDKRRRLDEQRAEIERLTAGVGVDCSGGKGRPDLAVALGAAVQARQEAKSASRDLERAKTEADKAESQRRGAAQAEKELEDRLRELGNGDVDRGAEAAVAWAEARSDAARLGSDLRREYPRLEDVKAEIKAAEADSEPNETDMWDRLEERLEEKRQLEARWDKKAKELQQASGRLDGDIEYLSRYESADEIKGQMEVLRTKIDDAHEIRDRAFLLARIVERADRDFQDQHQPTLLRQAGEYLSQMTGGRYHQIVRDVGDPSFYLRGPSIPDEPRRVEGALSQGTKEQAYLALRLAIVDHLDEGKEKLPLILDETLVNWDAERREWFFELLHKLSGSRQVFVFTVDKNMANQLEGQGALKITLKRSSG